MFSNNAILIAALQLFLLIATTRASTVQDIFLFPNGTTAENIAVRSCGKLLVTLLTAPEIWEVDPSTKTAELVYSFPNATGALGIAEVKPDVFAVVLATLDDVPLNGTSSVWSVDVSGKFPKTKLIAAMPDAGFLNGVTVPPRSGQYASALLLADSSYGLIWRLDLETGEYSVWLDDPAFKISPTGIRPIGINGVHSRGSDLYFTNA
jgi:hypothetical protein